MKQIILSGIGGGIIGVTLVHAGINVTDPHFWVVFTGVFIIQSANYVTYTRA